MSKQQQAILPLRERTKEACTQSMERRVNLVAISIDVLKQQGVEYRPQMYTPEQVQKMFDFLQSKLNETRKVFNSGLKPTAPKHDFTFKQQTK